MLDLAIIAQQSRFTVQTLKLGWMRWFIYVSWAQMARRACICTFQSLLVSFHLLDSLFFILFHVLDLLKLHLINEVYLVALRAFNYFISRLFE